MLAPPIQRGLGSRPALISDGGAITYETLEGQVNAVAAGLIQLGLKRGDLALIKMSNGMEFGAAFLAAVKLGVIPVLVNSMLRPANCEVSLEQAQPRLVFRGRALGGGARVTPCRIIQGCRSVPATRRQVRYPLRRCWKHSAMGISTATPPPTNRLSSCIPRALLANPRASSTRTAGSSPWAI